MNITNTQKGFTLIELMIVIAIIGILAAVALPAYTGYTQKAKMSEPLLAASTCRTEITEMFQTNATAGQIGAAGCENGTAGSPVSRYVESVLVSDAGLITVKLRNLSLGGTVLFTPLDNGGNAAVVGTTSAIGKWTCVGGGTAAQALEITGLLPASCKA